MFALVVFQLLFNFNLQASERSAFDEFVRSTAFLSLKNKMQELDKEINDLLNPYVEITECQYKNKNFLSKKHKVIMNCILEQTLSYLLDPNDLNHYILFKYHTKSKSKIKIGYMNIMPHIKLINKWWPISVYRDIRDQIFNISLRLKLVESVKLDIPEQFAKVEYDELIINFKQIFSKAPQYNYELMFFNQGIFKQRSWLDIIYEYNSLEVKYKNNYGIWDKL